MSLAAIAAKIGHVRARDAEGFARWAPAVQRMLLLRERRKWRRLKRAIDREVGQAARSSAGLREVVDAGATPPSEHARREERREAVAAAVARLKPGQREAVARLGIRVENVERRLKGARESLEVLLGHIKDDL